MFWTIVAKEIRHQLYSATFAYSFAAVAVLIVLTFALAAGNFHDSQSRYEAALAENLKRYEGMTDWYRVREASIMLPPQPLALLVSGVSNDIGRKIDVTPGGAPVAYGSRYGDEPIFAVFQTLDLLFIFLVVFSLFAVLLGYNSICGEREQGTLKLALSGTVTRSTLLMGKATGALLALGSALTIALLVGILLFPLLRVPLSGTDWIRAAVICLIGLLFFAVWLILSIGVSAVVRRPSSSFLVLLIIWIVSLLVIPRVAVVASNYLSDVPSVDEVDSRMASYRRDVNLEQRDALASYQGPSTELTEDPMAGVMHFQEYMDSINQIATQRTQEQWARLTEERDNASREREMLALTLSRISPAACLTLAASHVAGTELSLKHRFHEQADAYEDIFSSFLTEKTGMTMGGGMMFIIATDDDQQVEELIDPSEIPEFSFQSPQLAESMTTAGIDIGLLGMFGLLFILGGVVAFRNYDVR